MNLIEHYIIKVISVEDATKEWEEYMERKETDIVLRVEVFIDCFEHTEKAVNYFYKSEWGKIEEQGYYLS